MKKILYPLFIFTILFTIGCEDEKVEEEEVNPLIGVWEMETVSMTILSNPSQNLTITSDSDNNETMILGEDGTYSYEGKIDGDIDSGSGSWSSTSNKLTIVEDGETEIWDFSISGGDTHRKVDELTLNITTEETETDWGSEIEIVYTKQ